MVAPTDVEVFSLDPAARRKRIEVLLDLIVRHVLKAVQSAILPVGFLKTQEIARVLVGRQNTCGA